MSVVGTRRFWLLLVRFRWMLSPIWAEFRRTSQLAVPPAGTVWGVQVREIGFTPSTATWVVWPWSPAVAMIVLIWSRSESCACTVKSAEVLPSATCRVEGSDTAVLFAFS